MRMSSRATIGLQNFRVFGSVEPKFDEAPNALLLSKREGTVTLTCPEYYTKLFARRINPKISLLRGSKTVSAKEKSILDMLLA